jgi:predicted amidophosphoribosyltransferase
MVVPVPLHRQRKKERGFNQVELFAKPLAKRLGIPYRLVLLMRTRPRPENICWIMRKDGNRYVALLRSSRAGELTIPASCC